MESDVTADSLSSPEHGDNSTNQRDSGFGSMQSFSTQGPPGHTSSQRSSNAALDSFDLSPATEASTGGGGFLDGSSRQQHSSSSLRDVGGLTPLSESLRSSDLLSRDDGEDAAEEDFPQLSAIGTRGSVEIDIRRPRRDEHVVVAVSPLETKDARQRLRKRAREAATTNGCGDSAGLQQSRKHRLQSSWPIFRDRSAGGEGSQWDMSQHSHSPSFSRREGTASTDSSPRDRPGIPHEPRFGPREVTGRARARPHSRFPRDRNNNDGERASRGSGDKAIGGVGGVGGLHGNSNGTSVASSDGIGERFSVVSEVSSGGLPPPPVMPSGPLPAIGAIGEYLLTGPQQQHLDHERRLTADHMRRLNQVLAGHLPYREVSKLHAEGQSHQVLPAAPSHGSDVGCSPCFDDSRDVKGNACWRSPKQSVLRRLVLRVARERTKRALTKGWIRMWRLSAGARDSPATIAENALAHGSHVKERVERTRDGGHEDERRRRRKDDALDRFQRGTTIVDRIFHDRRRRSVFRGWSRLCLHAASLSAAEGASAAATALARAARAEAMEKEAQAAVDKAEAWRKAADASAKVAASTEEAQREAARGSILVAELERRKEDLSRLESEGQLRRAKLLIIRVCGERDRALMFRAWSRLRLHAASLSAAEGASATACAIARAARTEAMERDAKAAIEHAEATKRVAATSAEVAAARGQAKREAERASMLTAELQHVKEDVSPAEREHQLRRMKCLFTRVCGEKERVLMFRGWSRLCMHAASLSAAEGVSAAATALARAARAEAMEKEAKLATLDEVTSMREVAAARKKSPEEPSSGHGLAAELRFEVQDAEQSRWEQNRRRIKLLITRVCGERDRALVFRGWSRLCMHAASLSAAEGASAAATALARAARTKAMEKEAQAATEKAEAWRKAAAASAEVAAAREQAQRENARGSVLTADLKNKEMETSRVERQHELRRMKMLIIRVCGERDRALVFRGWSRLCLHAASLSAAEGASAAACAAARAARTKAMEVEAHAATEKAEAWKRAAAASADVATAREQSSQGNQLRRVKLMITRLCRERDKNLVLRGWIRLRLFTTSLSTAERGPTAANASRTASRADAIKEEAHAAATVSTGVVAEGNRAKEEADCKVASVSERAQEDISWRTRRAITAISRVLKGKDRRLLLRGWSRLCLHAASLTAADAAAATATAAARAARAEAEEKEAVMAQTSAGIAMDAAVARQKVEAAELDAKEHRERRALQLIGGSFRENNRRLLYHGWSRLCLNAVSYNVAHDVAGVFTAAASRHEKAVDTRAEKLAKRAEEAESAVGEQCRQQAVRLIARACTDRSKMFLFRGWTRLCLHAASPAATSRDIAAPAAPATPRTESKMDESNLPESTKEHRRGTSAPSQGGSEVGYAGAHVRAAPAAPEEAGKAKGALHDLGGRLIARICARRDARLLFRGWTRVCMHAARLNAAEAAEAAKRAVARAAGEEVAETAARANMEKVKASEMGAVAISESAAAAAERRKDTASGSMSPPELAVKIQEPAREAREHQLRWINILITRASGERDRALMFRGWSRLCLHATSLSAEEGVSAAACALARATRAEALQKEAQATIHKAAISSSVVPTSGEPQLQTARGSIPETDRRPGEEETSRAEREHQLRWIGILVARVAGEKHRALLSRGWSRLCLHAASLSAAEGASASVPASARAARAEAMEKEAKVAAEKAAFSEEVVAAAGEGQREIPHRSALAEGVERGGQDEQPAAREHQQRRAKMLIIGVCRERDRASVFRGWTRLCLHAASLSAAEGASAAASAIARAARTEAMEKEAQAATEKAEAWRRAAAASAEVAAAREQAKRSSIGVSVLAAELKDREANTAQMVREHQLRRMKMLISRVCGERDRTLMFRGWSRICLHAASLCAAEGASAAATAVARAARAEAMEKEAQAEAEKVAERRKATGASSEMAAMSEHAQREAACGSISAAELKLKLDNTEEILRDTQLRQTKSMITRVCRERDSAAMFRGWSRLCMHAASLSAAEGASAAATALARATRAEAMRMEAEMAADQAKTRQRAASASATVVAAGEQADGESDHGSTLVEPEQQEKDLEPAVREQQLRRMKMLIIRGCGERDRALMFRGWSRLCLHAASRSVAKETSDVTGAIATAVRSSVLEEEADVPPEKAAASADATPGRGQTQEETPRGSISPAVSKRKEGRPPKLEREHQLCLIKMMFTRVCGERDRALMTRGWSRLHSRATSVSVAGDDSPTAAALAGAAKTGVTEKEADVATGEPAASVDVAAGSGQTNEETARGSTLVAELRLKVKDTEKALQRQYLRRAKMLILRMCGGRDRALIFRGWSRLCLHAASLSAAEGASAAATALARAARAEAMEKEAQAAADKAEACRKAAAASAEVAAAREQAQREAVRGLALAAEVKSMEGGISQVEREHQLRRMKMLVVRVCGERDRALIFRGWSRLCLHAASLSAAEGASAAATALARAARAEAMEKEAQAAADKAEAWRKVAAASAEVAAAREQAQREAARGSALAAEVKSMEGGISQVEREHQLRRMRMLILRVCGERDRALIFRGWSRLCLHAASLSAVEGASAAATALARAARAEAMEKEAQATADKAEAWRKAAAASAEVAAAREQAQREAVRGSALAAEVKSRDEMISQADREHQLRRMRTLILRVCGERDRALVFRGWSRLCMQAASLSAADGASAAATALARAARAEAMEKEAQAAADKAEAWRKAAAASAEVAAAREQAQREAARGSALAAEVKSREEDMSQAEREHQLRRMKMLILRVCGGRDRALIFRGWSRLCLHAASLSAADGASAAATALARAARAEAMEKEAQAAADKAEAWRKAAAASAEVAAAREQAQREAARGSALAAEVKSREEDMSQAEREHQLRRMKMLVARVCGERDRALIFRGWSRLCMQAASISAADGASAAATALARAARAEAMEKEAQAATDKAEAWRKVAAASAEVAAAREQAQREAARGSALAAEVKSREEDMSQAEREHQLRRMRMLILRVCGERDRALVFRGWSRLCLHAASLSAVEGASAAATALARAARAEAMEKEAQAAADKAEAWRKAAAASAEVASAREQAQREAARGSALAAEVKSRDEIISQADREHQLRRMKMLIARVCGERDRARMFRGWSRLCLHAASLSAAEGASAAATALARAARAEAMEEVAADAAKTAADKMRAADLVRRKTSATMMVLKLVLKMERKAITRGWVRLIEATAVSAASTACEEETQNMGKMEAYAIELQKKAAKQGRELSRKTRALAILLRDDWAKAALERERETRAARLQLAQAEGELATQLNSMAGPAATGSGLAVAHNRKVLGRGKREGGERVGGSEEERRTAEGVAEVFLGEAGGGIGMVALQGEGARRLRAYVTGKGRALKRARVESEQWRARCGGMQRRLNDVLDSNRRETGASASRTQGKRLAAVLLDMLDERDRRLSNLCEDLISISTDGHSGEEPSNRKEGGRRREARRKAGRFLLRQMAAARDEARTHIHRLSDEVQRLEVAVRAASARANTSTPREDDFGRQLSDFDESDGKRGAHGEGHQGTSTGGRGLLVEAMNTTPSNQDGRSYPLSHVDDGVQAATDAHELVSALRSEVAALERHCATLQGELERLEDASAETIDETAASASLAKVAATKREQGRSSNAFETRRSISTYDGDGNLTARPSATNPDQDRSRKEVAIPRGKAGKRARAERRVRAAEVLREALSCNGGDTNIKRTALGAAAESEAARAVDSAREARQTAQENFAPRRVAETQASGQHEI